MRRRGCDSPHELVVFFFVFLILDVEFVFGFVLEFVLEFVLDAVH